MSSVLIVLATYNERENLPDLLAEIRDQVPEADLLVVDDSSPDGTGAWVRDQMREDPKLALLSRAGKQGLGTAVIAGLEYALERKYEYVVNMDADGSHPACYLPMILATANSDSRPDVVIGSRYVTGGRIVGWSVRRRIMSWGMNLLTRLVLRLSTRDNSGAFRCYRTDALARLDFSRFQSKGYSFFEEILYRLARSKSSFAEVPITFVDRVRGQSKISMKEALTSVWTLFLIH